MGFRERQPPPSPAATHSILPARTCSLSSAMSSKPHHETRLDHVSDERELLRRTAEIAADFVETLDQRPIRSEATVDGLRATLGGALAATPTDPLDVIEELALAAEPGVVAIPSGRYFGFVIGGSLPAALAADWLTSTWDQNACLVVCGPSAAVIEEVAGEWLKELLGIPATTVIGGDPARPSCSTSHPTCSSTAWRAAAKQVAWAIWQPVTNENVAVAGIPSRSLSHSPAISSMTAADGPQTTRQAF